MSLSSLLELHLNENRCSVMVPLEIPARGVHSLNICGAENDESMDGSMGGWMNWRKNK